MTQPSPSPVPSPSVAPHGPPSMQPTQPAATSSTSAGAPNTGDNPGKLPTTGPDAGLLVAAGLLAVVGGALLARRSRVRRGG